LFARRASTEQIFAIKESVERLAKVYANYMPDAFLRAKSEFYRILLEGADNPVVADMLRTIHTRVSQLRATSLSNPSRAAQSIAEIREFVAALEARNEEAAWHICVRHVQNAAEAALSVLTDEARTADSGSGKRHTKASKSSRAAARGP
jgi:DNA-binding GntR family transcriptional regulator